MRSLVLALALLFAPLAAEASGGPGNKTFGMGLTLGIPTGITAKVYFAPGPSLEFGFGALWPWGGFAGWLDFEYQFLNIRHRREDVLKVWLYVGGGIAAGFAGTYYYYYGNYPFGPVVTHPRYLYGYFGGPAFVSLRVPFGCTLHWTKLSFDTYAEVTPAIAFLPLVTFAPTFSVGGRYYF